MPKVIICIGVPASGKSTWARAQAADTGAVIVCRDDIRIMQGLKHGEDEQKVTKVSDAMLDGAISDGYDIIIADTNINRTFRNRLIKFCHKRAADVEIVTFPVPLQVAIQRDLDREASVGSAVITRMYQQMESQHLVDEDLPYQRFLPVVNTGYRSAKAIIVDIDGTVARHVSRSPYDYGKVSEDAPIESVLSVIRALSETYHVIFVSGRDNSCRHDTEAWLDDNYSPTYTLLMRDADDKRPDWVVKNEIYNDWIIPYYDILMVFDDRDQVVKHLRLRGITVAQVAEGRF